MTRTSLACLLLLTVAGGAAGGAAHLRGRWEGAHAAAVASAAVRDRATRRLDEGTAAARVRLALERRRAVPAEAAVPHLAVDLAEGRVVAARGDVVLRTAAIVTDWPVGIDTVLAIGDTLRLRHGGALVAEVGIAAADLRALRRIVGPGTPVYVR